MAYIYLDLNIFDRIEKRNNLPENERIWYDYIYNQIEDESIFTPYSNAHINDLLKDYEKENDKVDSHLDNIQFLSNDLAIVNYWGDNGVTWHYRDIKEFFQSSLLDISRINSTSLDDFFDNVEFGSLMKLSFLSKKINKLDNFKKQADSNPILKSIFPLAYEQQTEYALCEDIFNLNSLMRKDFTLFRKINGYIAEHKKSLKKYDKMFKALDGNTKPKSLEFDEELETFLDRSVTSKNLQHHNIITTYFRLNFEGYKTDKFYPNSIQDALHTYYASHCRYFVTNDGNCAYKANEVYKKLQYKTIAVNAQEYFEMSKK